MPVFDPLVADYRYFVADFLTNAVIAELPFKSVNYERSLNAAGTFSGTIPVIDATQTYQLYEDTMPGKTALYVVRNDECVWGGIIWSRSYSLSERSLSVSASEFTSYFYHRNIWKTFTNDYSATAVVSVAGTANVTLDSGSFDFVADMPVKLSFYEVANIKYDGTRDILSSPAPTTTTFTVSVTDANSNPLPIGTYTNVTVRVRVDTYDYIRQLLTSMAVDFYDITFPNNEIEPGSANSFTVSTKALTSNVATLTTTAPHDVLVGQVVDVYNVDATFDGSYEVTAITSTTVSYEKTAGNVASTPVSGLTRTVTAKNFERSTGVATLTTSVSHGFSTGQLVTVSGVDDQSLGYIIFDGSFIITSTPAANQFTYTTAHIESIALTSVSGTAVISPILISATYGPFSGNADFGLDFSTADYSGETHLPERVLRGFELRSIGEEIEEYSDALNGFEYRIDCSYDTVTSSFTRTFVFIPIDFPNPPAVGEVAPITRYGAQNYVFEYPGNILSVNIDESAEDAATRFFVVGNIGDLGADASQPYAAAAATDLLEQGWPLLDIDEAKNDISDETELYDHAFRYLSEFRPPVADMTVTVNGSLNPVVGSYAPGDWCSLIIDDYFVQQRLASNLEPRDDIVVRKIEGFSVQVPDNPSFPEVVSLKLIQEWEIDKVGE
jgi:hypothetical protein